MSLEKVSSNKVFDGELTKYKFKVRLAMLHGKEKQRQLILYPCSRMFSAV